MTFSDWVLVVEPGLIAGTLAGVVAMWLTRPGPRRRAKAAQAYEEMRRLEELWELPPAQK